MSLVVAQTLAAMLFVFAYETERDQARKFSYGVGLIIFGVVCLLVDCVVAAVALTVFS